MNETEMRIQYQLSNGNWVDCAERTDEFLGMCERATGRSRAEVLADMAAGREVRNDHEDWYSNCRSGSVYEARIAARRAAQKPAELVQCSCGHTVPRSQVMSASLGTACPECYDRMS